MLITKVFRFATTFKIRLWILLFIVSFGNSRADIQTTYSITPTEEDNFSRAKFTLWLAESKNLKGVIVLVPGWNGSPEELIKDTKWKAFAKSLHFALLICEWEGSLPYAIYDRAENGSGAALIAAIDQMARNVNCEYLVNLQLIICGHSAGGQFAYHFACWKPELVKGIVAVKGGFYEVEPTSDTRSIPSLWVVGELDLSYRVQDVRKFVDENCERGAKWSLVVDSRSKHEVGRGWNYARIYIKHLVESEAVERNMSPAWKPSFNVAPHKKSSYWFPGSSSANLPH